MVGYGMGLGIGWLFGPEPLTAEPGMGLLGIDGAGEATGPGMGLYCPGKGEDHTG